MAISAALSPRFAGTPKAGAPCDGFKATKRSRSSFSPVNNPSTKVNNDWYSTSFKGPIGRIARRLAGKVRKYLQRSRTELNSCCVGMAPAQRLAHFGKVWNTMNSMVGLGKTSEAFKRQINAMMAVHMLAVGLPAELNTLDDAPNVEATDAALARFFSMHPGLDMAIEAVTSPLRNVPTTEIAAVDAFKLWVEQELLNVYSHDALDEAARTCDEGYIFGLHMSAVEAFLEIPATEEGFGATREIKAKLRGELKALWLALCLGVGVQDPPENEYAEYEYAEWENEEEEEWENEKEEEWEESDWLEEDSETEANKVQSKRRCSCSCCHN